MDAKPQENEEEPTGVKWVRPSFMALPTGVAGRESGWYANLRGYVFTVLATVGAAAQLPFLYINLARDLPMVATYNGLAAVALLLDVLWYRRSRNQALASLIGIMIAEGFLASTTPFMGVRNLYWMFLIPWLASFLLGLRLGLVFAVLGGVTTVTSLFLSHAHTVSSDFLVDALGSYALVTVIAAMTEHVRSRYADDLEQRALTDALTGLWNRRGGCILIRRAVAASQRHDHGLSFITFDIDRFKTVNDQHGHAAGDRVLIEIAALARNAVRAADEVVRWGGEEFLVLMPHTGVEQASEVAERLRENVSAHDFGNVGAIRVSAGVASVAHGAESTWEAHLRRADQALYQAKESGRDRVVVFRDENPPSESEVSDPLTPAALPGRPHPHPLR